MDFLSHYLALWTFIIVMVSTPGPANMLLMTAGAQHGLVKTLPFIAGLTLGKLLLNVALALGLMGIIESYPSIAKVFVYCSGAYMTYLALRNWTPASATTKSTAFTFWSGSVVHPLSPKTWMMATLALTQFGDAFSSAVERLLVVPLSFLVAQVFFAIVWCLLGSLLSRAFEHSLVMHRALILLTLAVIVWAMMQ